MIWFDKCDFDKCDKLFCKDFVKRAEFFKKNYNKLVVKQRKNSKVKRMEN